MRNRCHIEFECWACNWNECRHYVKTEHDGTCYHCGKDRRCSNREAQTEMIEHLNRQFRRR
jgi:hypothetical protein